MKNKDLLWFDIGYLNEYTHWIVERENYQVIKSFWVA